MAEGFGALRKNAGRMCVQRITITYSAAVSVCEKGRLWPQALELFKRMKSDSVPWTTIIYSAVISAFEKGEQFKFF